MVNPTRQQESLATTREKLETALNRLVNVKLLDPEKVKITPTSVAREVGVDRATLYRYHAPLLLAIKSANFQKTISETARTSERANELRKLAEDAQSEVAALARINYRISAEYAEMKNLLAIKERAIADLRLQVATLTSQLPPKGALKSAK